MQKLMEKAHKAAIEGLKRSIADIEAQLHTILIKDDSIKKNYDLLVTVPGVGHLTALYVITCTNNFAAKISGKQLGSYALWCPLNTKAASV